MRKNQTDSQIIIYEGSNGILHIDVRVQEETVWLTIDQMAELFGKSRSTINEHILNIYQENELNEIDSIKKIGNSDFSTKSTKK